MKLSDLGRLFGPIDYKGSKARRASEQNDDKTCHERSRVGDERQSITRGDAFVYSFTGHLPLPGKRTKPHCTPTRAKRARQCSQGTSPGFISKLRKSASLRKLSRGSPPPSPLGIHDALPATPESLQMSIFSTLPELPPIRTLPSLPELDSPSDCVLPEFMPVTNETSQTSLFRTSLYFRQNKSRESLRSLDCDNPFESKHVLTLGLSSPEPPFTFELPNGLHNEHFVAVSTPVLSKKRSAVPTGLAICSGSKLNSNNPFLSVQLNSPLSHKNSTYDLYEPLNRSEVVPSNRHPLMERNANIQSPLTPLKIRRRPSPPRDPFHIERRAQMDSQTHLKLVASPVIEADDTVDSDSMYEGLSAAELNDYQKVVMWANH